VYRDDGDKPAGRGNNTHSVFSGTVDNRKEEGRVWVRMCGHGGGV
jgi:hypothetical protein